MHSREWEDRQRALLHLLQKGLGNKREMAARLSPGSPDTSCSTTGTEQRPARGGAQPHVGRRAHAGPRCPSLPAEVRGVAAQQVSTRREAGDAKAATRRVCTATGLIRCAAIPKLPCQVLLTDPSLPNVELCFLNNSAINQLAPISRASKAASKRIKLCTQRARTTGKQVSAPRFTFRVERPSVPRAPGDANDLVTGTPSPAPDTHWLHPRTASALAPVLQAVDPRAARRALPTPGRPSPAVPAGLPASRLPSRRAEPGAQSRREPQRGRCWTEAPSPAAPGRAAPHPRHCKALPYSPYRSIFR